MKVPFIFLLIGALALQNIDNVSSLEFFGDILQNLDKLGEHIRAEFIDEIKNLSANTSEPANELETNLREQAAEAIKNLEETGSSSNSNAQQIIITNVDTFQAILQAFIQTLEDEINNQTNSIKLSALKVTQSALENILKRSASLARIFNDLSTRIQNGVIQGQQRIEGIWSVYINTQLRQVARATSDDESKISQANTFLNNILQTYDAELEKCASSVESSLSDFTNKVNDSILIGRLTLEDLLEVVQNCLDAENTTELDDECRDNINAQLEQLADIPDEISSLAAEGASLLLVRFDSSACVGQTLIKFELEKIHIRVTIRQIINGSYDDSSA